MPPSLVALALAAAALPSVQPPAGGWVEHYSVTIPYDHDADRMADRIDTAARRTCDRQGIMMVIERREIQACKQQFKAGARQQVQLLLSRQGMSRAASA